VTDSADVGVGARLDRRVRIRAVVVTLIRVVAINAVLLTIYFLLPLDRTSAIEAIVLLTVGLLALAGLVALQVRTIIRAEYPVPKAVGALATSAPLFMLLFAGTYFVLGNLSASNFSQHMTRIDALYFTVTVFATVGFGDITAVSEPARAIVTGQMVAGIVIVGLGARIIVDAVKYGREQVPLPSSDGGSNESEAGSPPS
jgi:voltage-gated potassium channel